MLGRIRRTTRTDVGLALAFGGIAYLVCVAALGAGRHVVNAISRGLHADKATLSSLPGAPRWLCHTFLQAAAVLDIVAVLWLVLSLALIVGASRQKWSISWAWMSAVGEALAAALLGVWAAVAAASDRTGRPAPADGYPTTGWTFLSVAVALALVLWVTVLVWLLYERARLGRGPSLRDGLRTHVPG
jgi:hypothetical protein